MVLDLGTCQRESVLRILIIRDIASGECEVSDCRHTFGYNNFLQGGADGKGTFSDYLQCPAGGECQRLCTVTTVEGGRTDGNELQTAGQVNLCEVIAIVESTFTDFPQICAKIDILQEVYTVECTLPDILNAVRILKCHSHQLGITVKTIITDILVGRGNFHRCISRILL